MPPKVPQSLHQTSLKGLSKLRPEFSSILPAQVGPKGLQNRAKIIQKSLQNGALLPSSILPQFLMHFVPKHYPPILKKPCFFICKSWGIPAVCFFATPSHFHQIFLLIWLAFGIKNRPKSQPKAKRQGHQILHRFWGRFGLHFGSLLAPIWLPSDSLGVPWAALWLPLTHIFGVQSITPSLFDPSIQKLTKNGVKMSP